MLTLNHVTKSFKHITAVKSIDLTAEKGKTTVLIGPSGCGKSTILRLIVGLIMPDSGTIKLGQENVIPQTIRNLRRRIGYVIQEGGLFPHMTSRKNIILMADFLGWERNKIESRLDYLINLTQFPYDALNRYPAQLSGGQRQRLSLMRSLMLDPELLLMDEPLGALDPMIRIDLQVELKSIFKQLEKTVLIVTHDLGEAGYLGDTLVLMREGRIIQTGTLESLVTTPSDPFVTRFINAQRSPLEEIQSGRER